MCSAGFPLEMLVLPLGRCVVPVQRTVVALGGTLLPSDVTLWPAAKNRVLVLVVDHRDHDQQYNVARASHFWRANLGQVIIVRGGTTQPSNIWQLARNTDACVINVDDHELPGSSISECRELCAVVTTLLQSAAAPSWLCCHMEDYVRIVQGPATATILHSAYKPGQGHAWSVPSTWAEQLAFGDRLLIVMGCSPASSLHDLACIEREIVSAAPVNVAWMMLAPEVATPPSISLVVISSCP